MMSLYQFTIHPDVPIESAWDELEVAGVEVLYSDEDSEGQNKTIICRLSSDTPKEEWQSKLSSVLSIQPAAEPIIDWEAQWSEHGLNYHEGFVHINVGGIEFLLKPGPGFGDASHPTTRLLLEIMENVVRNRTVLDIGCGSGILTIAAARLGAFPIYAIDIDPEAIRHTIDNIVLNEIEKPLWVGSAKELIDQKPKKPLIALMNMISSEQQEAWASLKPLHPAIGECLTSGILVDEKSTYLNRWKEEHWEVKSTVQEGEWLAFHLVRSKIQPLS